jgi:uncharacterized YigZ family protein
LNSYKSLAAPFQSEILKIKKSKFIGCAYPVATEVDIKKAFEKIRSMHTSASHWCYAYKIGTENVKFKANDDGEPKNSAGMPILGQIKAFDLTNVLVVVVRYYGGTKLGVGGLKTAYKEAAKLCLSGSNIIEQPLLKHFLLHFKYPQINAVMRCIKQYDLTVIEQKLELDCKMHLAVPKSDLEEVTNTLQSIREIKFEVS